MPVVTRSVFMDEYSQAMRIPQDPQLDVSRVSISRSENGDLIVPTLPDDRGQALLDALTGFDADFITAMEEARALPDPPQEREPL